MRKKHGINVLPVPPLKHQVNRAGLAIKLFMRKLHSVQNGIGDKQSPHYRFYGTIFNL